MNTTVPVEKAQSRPEQEGNAADLASPQLPLERVQSVGMTDGIPSAKVQQSHRDVKRGLVDTDAGREAHNVGKPVEPREPPLPGTPGPVEPDHK